MNVRTCTAAVAAVLLLPAAAATPAFAQPSPAPDQRQGMSRMHERTMSGEHPGMARMHERMMSRDNPGMARMHEACKQAAQDAKTSAGRAA